MSGYWPDWTGHPGVMTISGAGASPSTTGRVRRGLVLGAGGVLGGCWALGVLNVLREHGGGDPRRADVIIGTSVGSVLASLLGAGISVADLVEHQYEQPRNGPLVNVHLDHDEMLPPRLPALSQLVGSPQLLRSSIRHPLSYPPLAALAALCPCGTSSFHPMRTFLGEVLTGSSWPEDNHVVATNYDTGERTMFSGADGFDVLDAVAASCAVPGCFPPVAIGEHRYVDGSVVSVTSADLLAHAGLDEVCVLAPMGARSFDAPTSAVTWLERGVRVLLNRALWREVEVLRQAGTRVTVLAPGAQDLAVMGVNTMDPSHRLQVLDTAQETAPELLRTAWN